MGDLIMVRSDHSEYLGDGREVPPGEYAADVDLTHPVNADLEKRGVIIKLESEHAEKLQLEPIPAPPVEEEVDEHEPTPTPAPKPKAKRPAKRAATPTHEEGQS